MNVEYILTLSCPNRAGIVAAISVFLSEHNCNIKDSAQYDDQENGLFFMRVYFRAEDDAPDVATLKAAFAPLAANALMRWGIYRSDAPCRTIIMVSQYGHCLNDLLFRYRTGALMIEIPCVISNHREFQHEVEWHGIPYHYLPVDETNKAEQENAALSIIKKENADLVVLARYMQILSERMCRELEGRCINIHHSFLPSFKGANPYKRAHERGVKLIGATAHYVTAQLDEGPIIDQDVERVDHAHTVEDFAALGRDVERVVLARAVRNHVERRILLNGKRTVVLR